MAEEGVVRMLQREPHLFARAQELSAEQFSVEMFGRVFEAWRERWQEDLEVSPACLTAMLSPAEMSHLTAVLQKQDAPLSDEAFDDCVRIITEEYRRAQVSDAGDLKALQERLRRKKGYGGT